MKTARELRDSGHCITYTGLPQCRNLIINQGFSFVPMFGDWFPEDQDFNKKDFSNYLGSISSVRKYIKYLKKFINSLMSSGDQEFFRKIREVDPDIVIIVATHYDSFIWALLSYKAGIKSIYLHDTLCKSKSYINAPITTNIIPDDSFICRIRILFEWFLLFANDFLYSNILGIQLSKSYGVDKLCRHYEYPIRLVNKDTDMLAPKITIPEIVLCPKIFDFPAGNEVGRYYVGPSIDLERDEPFLDWIKVDATKKIIYCALGSLDYLTKNDRIKFFNTILDAAQFRMDLYWIISIGTSLNFIDLNKPTENVLLVNMAPQLNVLRRASVMISHGGTNTIKECIYFGVPMIVFPLGFDHPGNAARVGYHGLGIVGNIKKLTNKSLLKMIYDIENNSYYLSQIRILKQRFLSEESNNTAVNIINTILGVGEKVL